MPHSRVARDRENSIEEYCRTRSSSLSARFSGWQSASRVKLRSVSHFGQRSLQGLRAAERRVRASDVDNVTRAFKASGGDMLRAETYTAVAKAWGVRRPRRGSVRPGLRRRRLNQTREECELNRHVLGTATHSEVRCWSASAHSRSAREETARWITCDRTPRVRSRIDAEAQPGAVRCRWGS